MQGVMIMWDYFLYKEKRSGMHEGLLFIINYWDNSI